MNERFAEVGDLRLCYEAIGEAGHPAVLLMTGVGGQLVHWPAPFCHDLAGRGYYVIRYDHRDAGRSTVLDHLGYPPRYRLLMRDGSGARYTLGDMAGDAVGLLDALGIDAAHVVGISLGGIVAQTTAVRHPERVRSLVSIASNTGASRDHPNPAVLLGMLARPSRNRKRFIRQTVIMTRLIGSSVPVEEVRRLAGVMFDRGMHAEGTWRQLAANFAAGDRTEELAGVRAPTLVIHGTRDPILPVTGGKATAAAIPGAELQLVPGMGHEIPREHWGQFIDWIVANGQRSRTS